MLRRFLGSLGALVLCATAPAFAQLHQVAPADEYFGRFNLSVLGIANIIHDSPQRVDEGRSPAEVIAGPLSFVTDAIGAWEAKYPSDPWIARSLFGLENAYLRIHTPASMQLARKTLAWLQADFPKSAYAEQGRDVIGESDDSHVTTPFSAWTRFADLRAPIATPH